MNPSPRKKIAVVLLNLGGPNSEAAVQPFLYNLFMDEDIIKIPLKGRARHTLIQFLTKRRAKTSGAKYKEINACPAGCQGPATCSNRIAGVVSTCCSPINPRTEDQRAALEHLLRQQYGEKADFEVITCMRYWHPDTDTAIRRVLDGGFEEVVLLPLFPQFSYTTTASSYNEWTRKAAGTVLAGGSLPVHYINSYHLHPDYIAAINARIDEALARLPEQVRPHVQLLFSAHGTPVSEREAGDPYSLQLRETIRAVMEARGNDLPFWETFQSRVGPVAWLKPNTEHFIHTLHGYGVKDMLLIPIAFVSDHIETLHEIGIEFKEVADHLGVRTFVFTEGLNAHPGFIATLGDLVARKLGL